MQPLLQYKSNKYYIFWVCVCSLCYPACNAHAPYCHLCPIRLYIIFFVLYLVNVTIFEKKQLLHITYVLIFSTNWARFIHSLVFSLEGRAWQEPEPCHVTGMTLAHCILGKFLGVVCYCFPPSLDVPTLAARCVRQHDQKCILVVMLSTCYYCKILMKL